MPGVLLRLFGAEAQKLRALRPAGRMSRTVSGKDGKIGSLLKIMV